MTTYKTSELEGALLDAAVAQLERQMGCIVVVKDGACWIHSGGEPQFFAPSLDWNCGGPIIEREGIEIVQWDPDGPLRWGAFLERSSGDPCVHDADAYGATALVAAMRAFVSAKLGPEVDL